MSVISLVQAQAAIEGALAKAAATGCRPVAVAIVDAGGHAIALARQDGAAFLRSDIAVAKAAGALGLGLSSRLIGQIAATNPAAIAGVAAIAPRGAIASPGGVIVVDASGAAIGAIAVSGDSGDNDEACARAGAEAARLTPQATDVV